MKTIKVAEPEAMEILLNDKSYVCTFNMLSMAYMQEELGKLDGKLDEISPARLASIILYSGIKSTNEDITMDEAVALAIKMGPGHYSEVIRMYNESLINTMDEKTQKQTKKMLTQYLASVMK